MLKRLWPAALLALWCSGCGGGGGGSSTPAAPVGPATASPSPVPGNTAPPTNGSFAPAGGGVTTLAGNAANTFGSTMLTASTDGTFIIQSPETPGESGSATFTLPEYTVTGTETAGQSTAAAQRAPLAVHAQRTADGRATGFRPRLDPRTTLSFTRSALRRHPLQVGPNGGRVPLAVRRPQALSVGATNTFHIDQFKITGASSTCSNPVAGFQCFVDRPSTLMSVSNFAYVWVDNAVLNDSSTGLTQVNFDGVGALFDQDYAKETALFGQAFVNNVGGSTPSFTQCDSSGHQLATPGPVPDLSNADPRISIVITNALESNGEGGYFSLANLVSQAELECSSPGNIEVTNGMKMFVIGADTYQTGTAGNPTTVKDASFWQNFDMPRSIAHEFQHYLHAVNRYLNPTFASNGAQGNIDDAFVDEGCAMLAEDIVQPGNAQSEDAAFLAFLYLFQSGNYSLTSFSGFDANPLDTSATPTYGFFHNTGGDYGQAYLFMRYIFDRFGSAGIARMFADRTPTVSSQANVAPVLAASGESFAQLYAEFAAALSASGTASTDPRFNFSPQVRLRGEMFFHEPGGTQVYSTFNGPRSPEDLTATSPGTVGRIKFTVGGSVSAKLLQGATLFFNAAPNATNGATVRAQVTGAPAGSPQAILVQGAYTDKGSCAAPVGDPNCNPTVTP